MKKLLFILLANITLIYPQTYKFAWLTDIHIGTPTGIADLKSVVENINKRDDISFVVATGDIAERGLNSELDSAKNILDKLKFQYYVIPGNHDTKWSESFGTKFAKLWKDDKFHFEYNKDVHIGLNSGIPWKGGGGHLKSDDLEWVKNILSQTTKDANIYFYIHHPLPGDVDNFHQFVNIVKGYNIKGLFVGHGHGNRVLSFNGIPSAMSRSVLSRGKKASYNISYVYSDSVSFYETNDSTSFWWGSISSFNNVIASIDTVQFINNKSKVFSQLELKKTYLISPIIYNNDLITTSIDGVIQRISNNKIQWETKVGTTASTPIIINKLLYIFTYDGTIKILDLSLGKIKKEIETKFNFSSSAIENDGKIYVGTVNGEMICLNKYLDYLYTVDYSDGMIENKPLFIKNRIIYGSWDGFLNCIDAFDGKLLWKWTENKNFYYSPAAGNPVTDGKSVFVSTPDKFISSIDIETGKTKWRKNHNSWESVGISANKQYLFVKCYENSFKIIDSQSGEEKESYDLMNGLDTMPIDIFDYDNQIMFGGKNGKIYNIKDGTVKPILFMGDSRILTLTKINKNKFAALNMDGRLVVFGTL